MPLPWKKSKSGRISRFVSDFQQSPKHGGSLVVETGFPTSLIDLFVKNRDRLKKQSSKRNNNNKSPPIQSIPTRRRDSSQPSPPPPQMQRHKSLPSKLYDPSSVKDVRAPTSRVEEIFVINDGGLTSENKLEDGGNDGGGGGGGGCVLMVVAFKVFVVAVLALSTKRLAVGITLSAFALIFLEIAVARVFTLLNLCPNARVRFGSLIGKIVGKKKQRGEEEKKQEESPPERKNRVTFEIIEESTLEEAKPVEVEEGEREVETIRDVVFKKEKSKSSKLKSKIVKKIVPKKLRSYKKKKKMKNRDEDVEIIEIIGGGDDDDEEEEEEESVVTEVSSLFSDDRIGSEISERDEVSTNPPLLESCEEVIKEEGKGGSKEDLTKVMVLIVIILAGLLNGKVVAIGLTLSSCLILRLVCYNKSQTSL